MIGVLKADSRFVGTTVGTNGRALGGDGSNIVAIIRGEHMMVPSATTVFATGDRLILVAGDAALAGIRRDLAPW